MFSEQEVRGANCGARGPSMSTSNKWPTNETRAAGKPNSIHLVVHVVLLVDASVELVKVGLLLLLFVA